jgi:hypothetical protein
MRGHTGKSRQAHVRGLLADQEREQAALQERFETHLIDLQVWRLGSDLQQCPC